MCLSLQNWLFLASGTSSSCQRTEIWIYIYIFFFTQYCRRNDTGLIVGEIRNGSGRSVPFRSWKLTCWLMHLLFRFNIIMSQLKLRNDWSSLVFVHFSRGGGGRGGEGEWGINTRLKIWLEFRKNNVTKLEVNSSQMVSQHYQHYKKKTAIVPCDESKFNHGAWQLYLHRPLPFPRIRQGADARGDRVRVGSNPVLAHVPLQWERFFPSAAKGVNHEKKLREGASPQLPRYRVHYIKRVHHEKDIATQRCHGPTPER